MQGLSTHISQLILKSLEDALSPSERMELDAWLNASSENQRLFDEINKPVQARADLRLLEEDAKTGKMAFQKVLSAKASQREGKVLQLKTWYRYIAAAVVLVMAVGVYWFSQSNSSHDIKNNDSAVVKKSDTITPGRDAADLQLSDGTIIKLDSAGNNIPIEKGDEIAKDSGSLNYQSTKNLASAIHTLKTGKGEQFEVKLPDGSQVKLNALTTLSYPSRFTGPTRNVTLSTGEAFFQITKDISKPFIVKVKGVDIRVLGTSFNVNAYGDVSTVQTTLFEGSVKARNDTLDVKLKPGQEFRYDSTTKKWKLVKVDLETAAAWRHNLFNLENTDVPTLMREISRWYDVEIIYSNGFPKQHFEGHIPRTMDFSDLLDVLRDGGVETKLEGRKLIVL
ncbi:MAG: FecR domain-containing protein [Chitinophagaceae bacterium]